jgi:uncharacterized protein YbjT (DUF2867 family)
MAIIVVTGGTGFVGRAIVQKLLSAGHEVRVLTRPHRPTHTPLITHERLTYLPTDLNQADQIAARCQGADAVIHLIGIIHETAATSFAQAHRETTRAVLSGAKAAGVPRYLHMSALGTRPHARARYHQTKWEAEELVRASGLNWTIFRPSLIFGRGDGFVTLFARLLTFPCNALNLYTFPRLGGGHSLFQPIAVGEVAQAFVESLRLDATARQTYDLCGRERLTLTTILQQIITATGQRSVVEDFPLLTALRFSLWGLVLLIPALLLLAATQPLFPRVWILTGLGLWLPLLGAAFVWRTILLFSLPWFLAWPVAYVGQYLRLFGQPLLTPDQLSMLEEGNTGEPEPAATIFQLPLQRMEAGIRDYLPLAKD